MTYNSKGDTLDHIQTVRDYLGRVAKEFIDRAANHDTSKLNWFEKEAYDEYVPALRNCEFGSDEYKSILEKMGPHLKYHYMCNPGHHPEAHPAGINDMNLFDLVEMLFDWKAANARSKQELFESLEIQKDRYKISDQLFKIMVNTFIYCDQIKSSRITITLETDEGPLDHEDFKKLKTIVESWGHELKDNFWPLSDAEKEDPGVLYVNMYTTGCPFLIYSINDVDPHNLQSFVSQIKSLKLKKGVLRGDHKSGDWLVGPNMEHKWQPIKSDPRVPDYSELNEYTRSVINPE